MSSMNQAVLVALLLWAGTGSALAQAIDGDDRIKAARARWEYNTHGQMLRRILPPTTDAAQLPEPTSRGAQLTVQYCVQCHNLAPPAMHHAAKWPAIVNRMVPRMHGKGNMGAIMKDLMMDVETPGPTEIAAITAYLQKHAQRRVNTATLPEANKSRAWVSFVQACSQCHVAPDPQRHSRDEWPQVVARMERNMEWMNRVVGSKTDPREPQYRSDEIVAYLQRYAKR